MNKSSHSKTKPTSVRLATAAEIGSARVSSTANNVKSVAEQPRLLQAIDNLSNVIGLAEEGQDHIRRRLRRILAESDRFGETGDAADPSNEIEPALVDVIDNLVSRVGWLITSQNDVLNRLQV